MGSTYYGIAYPRYWTGQTGRAIKRHGGAGAQLLGAYLLVNDAMNMIGLYALRLSDVRADLALTDTAIAKALAVLAAEQYAYYDPASEFVWVREMARFRLGIQDERPLAPADKKAIGAQRLYAGLPSNPWLGPFFDRYASLLHLKRRRDLAPAAEIPAPAVSAPEKRAPIAGGVQIQGFAAAAAASTEGASKGLARGFEVPSKGLQIETPQPGAVIGGHTTSAEGASKGLARGIEGACKGHRRGFEASNRTESETESGTDQKQGAAHPIPARQADDPDANLGVITRLSHEAIDLVGVQSPDLAEVTKQLCARHRVAYDSATVRKAVESATVQRAHRDGWAR